MPKENQKSTRYFRGAGAAGCGSLRLLRALGGTRILQAAAPTAPPCFGRWSRSSPLQTRGCSPLVTPKQLGSIQKIQVAALKDFLCSADFKAPQPLRRQLPAGEQARPLPFAVQSHPVKSESRKIRRFSGFLSIKIIVPLKMPRAKRRAF